LVEQVLHLLEPRPGDVILDGTVGLGGHAAALLPHIMPSGRYVGLDLDEELLKGARARLGEGVELHQANFASFPEVLVRAGVRQVDRMLLDLGVNSVQLEDAARGFSFGRDGPLDMRYDRRQELLALDLVNRLSERELADVFYHNGQEPGSRKVARRICQVRHEGRITSGRRSGRIHPATRVFMALRIEVNHELDNLREFLRQVPEFLRPGGRLAVISFHSLEDGIVKQFLRAAKAAGTLQEITRRPVVADPQERTGNPRSRSAKLRVAVRQEEPAQQGGSDGPE
jgi:16S rRNA (cytosine1402-N4)-methyltransferase